MRLKPVLVVLIGLLLIPSVLVAMKTLGSMPSNTEWPIASAARVADLAIANTETVVISKVFDADDLTAGATFMVRAFATRAGTQSAAPVIRIRIGTTTLQGNIAATLTPPIDTLAVGNEFEGFVTIRTAGAGGTALGSLKRTVHLAAVTVSAAIGITAAPVTVNTTLANQRIELTFISGHASNTYTFRNAVLYRVN